MSEQSASVTPDVLEIRSFLRRFRTEILAEWRRMAREIPVARDLPGITLVDHVPELLDELANATEQLLGKTTMCAPEAAQRHAVDRLGAGFEISAVVDELSLLRRCILGVWNREHEKTGDEIVALNVAMDRAIAASVSRYAEARERTLIAIDRISTAALEAPDLDSLLQRLLSVFAATTRSVEAAGIMLMGEDGRLHLRAVVGLDEQLTSGFSLAIGEGFAGKVARDREPVQLRAAYLDPLVKNEAIRKAGIRALYGVPLVDHDSLIGVAYMGSVGAHEFSSDDRHLFDSTAARATIAIHEHMLRNDLLRARREQQRLAEGRISVLAKLESLLAASPIGIAFFDRELRYLRINESLASLGGRPAADHIGRSLREMSPEVAPALEPILRRVLETGEPVINLELSTPAESPGQGRSFLATFFTVRSSAGALTGVGAVLVEVTELRQAREALRVSEARWQSILEHSPAAIFVLDEDRRFVIANQQTAAALGHPGEDLVGRYASEIVPAELEAIHRETDQRVLREQRAVTEEEEALASDGRRTFLSIKFPIPGDPGHLVCGIATDITERKRMEMELREAVRLREEVLAIVSHDLRNPLATVHLSVTMLLTELGLDARARKHVEMIERAIARMQHLIDDLLDTARIHSGKLALDIKRERPERVIAEAIDLQTPLAREKGITLRNSCAATDIYVDCDRDRVLQVCGNLISNAIKFGRAGDSVTIGCEHVGDEARFSVADTGPGIAPELVPHLFDAYWSAPGQAKLGTGLGLYIARGIVEQHGGRIWVETEPGAGATFFFTLPVVR